MGNYHLAVVPRFDWFGFSSFAMLKLTTYLIDWWLVESKPVIQEIIDTYKVSYVGIIFTQWHSLSLSLSLSLCLSLCLFVSLSLSLCLSLSLSMACFIVRVNLKSPNRTYSKSSYNEYDEMCQKESNLNASNIIVVVVNCFFPTTLQLQWTFTEKCQVQCDQIGPFIGPWATF